MKETLNKWLNETFNDYYIVEYKSTGDRFRTEIIHHSPSATTEQLLKLLQITFDFDEIFEVRVNDLNRFAITFLRADLKEWLVLRPLDNNILHSELI